MAWMVALWRHEGQARTVFAAWAVGAIWAGNDLLRGGLASNVPAVGRLWGAVGWLSRDAGRRAQ